MGTSPHKINIVSNVVEVANMLDGGAEGAERNALKYVNTLNSEDQY